MTKVSKMPKVKDFDHFIKKEAPNWSNSKKQTTSNKAPNFKIQITNKSQIPIFNDQTC